MTFLRQLPWVGCALGMIISSLFVVLDYLSHGHTSHISHPLLKILTCAVSAALGYWSENMFRKMSLKFTLPFFQRWSTISDIHDESEKADAGGSAGPAGPLIQAAHRLTQAESLDSPYWSSGSTWIVNHLSLDLLLYF